MTVAIKLHSCTFYIKIRIWPCLDRFSCSEDISLNNIGIISPKILKTRKLFLNGETSLCEISHLILQLKTLSRVVLIVNLIQIISHVSDSCIKPQIENKVRLNWVKDPSHNLSILDFPFRQSLDLLRYRSTPINITPQYETFDK
jgi:hypothetical protein